MSNACCSSAEHKSIEEVFGWSKAAAGFRRTRRLSLARVNCMFTLTATAYNLVQPQWRSHTRISARR